MPSLPTTAISAEAPLSIAYSSETTAVVGKTTCVIVSPDSYSTWPSGISTHSNCGSQRCHSASGSAANRRFFLGRGQRPLRISNKAPPSDIVNLRLNCALCQFSRPPTHLSVRHPTDTHNCFRYRNFGITAASANRRRRKRWNRSRLPSVDCRPSCAVEVIGTPRMVARSGGGNPGRMTSEAHTGRRSAGA